MSRGRYRPGSMSRPEGPSADPAAGPFAVDGRVYGVDDPWRGVLPGDDRVTRLMPVPEPPAGDSVDVRDQLVAFLADLDRVRASVVALLAELEDGPDR